MYPAELDRILLFLESLKNEDIFELATTEEFLNLPDVPPGSLIRARSDAGQSIAEDEGVLLQFPKVRSVTPEGSVIRPVLQNDVIQRTDLDSEDEEEDF